MIWRNSRNVDDARYFWIWGTSSWESGGNGHNARTVFSCALANEWRSRKVLYWCVPRIRLLDTAKVWGISSWSLNEAWARMLQLPARDLICLTLQAVLLRTKPDFLKMQKSSINESRIKYAEGWWLVALYTCRKKKLKSQVPSVMHLSGSLMHRARCVHRF